MTMAQFSFIAGLMRSPLFGGRTDGGKILMWYSKSYAQVNSLFGLAFLNFQRGMIRCQFFSTLILIRTTNPTRSWFMEPSTKIPTFSRSRRAWSTTGISFWAYPKLEFSGFARAMDYITRQFGASIPVVRGDGGPTWEFGNASDAETLAVERETEQRAPSAEKFSTISSIVDSRVQPEREVLKRLWNNIGAGRRAHLDSIW